jgi:CVNH domain
VRVHLLRSWLIAGVLCGFSLAACASGDSDVGPTGTGAALEEDGSVSDAAVAGDAGAVGATGPAVHDGGQTGVIGASIDGGEGGDGAAPSGASADGGTESGPSRDDAAPDAPVSCGSPSGTYSSSCQNCAVTGTMLTCDCATGSGPSSPTSLDLCSCPVLTEISNSNGTLSCCGVPGGSYTSNCSNCALTGTVLSCTCKTSSGMSSPTTLNLCSCSQATQIADTNGQLTCP